MLKRREARGRKSGQPCACIEAAQQRGAKFARGQRPSQRVDTLAIRVDARTTELALATDADMFNRICPACSVRPHANGFQSVDGGPGERKVSFVIARLRLGAGGGAFHQCRGNAGGIQGDGQTGAHQAAANDQHGGDVLEWGHGNIHRPMIPADPARFAAGAID